MNLSVVDKEQGPLRLWFNALGWLVSWSLFRYLLSLDLPEKLVTRNLQVLNRWALVFILLHVGAAVLVGYGLSGLLYSWLSRYGWFKNLNSSRSFGKTTNLIWFSVVALLVVLILRSEPGWLAPLAGFLAVWGVAGFIAFLMDKRTR